MNIIVIGAGQIGSRHIQSLCTLDIDLELDIVDPATESLNKVQNLLEREKLNVTRKKISYLHSLNGLKSEYDFGIIATSSNVRKGVLKELLEKTNVRYLILEKFLFPKLSEYDEADKILSQFKGKVWVNCSRREMDIYKEIKTKIKESTNVSFTVSGSNWFLGSNAIHLIDIFCFLTNTSEPQITPKFLDKEIIANKRANFIDFTGTLIGTNPKNDFFSLTSFKNGSNSSHMLITTNEMTYILNESKGIGFYSNKNEDISDQQFSFKFPFQSELTAKYITKIVETGSCNLPTYEESSRIHKVILRAFIDFLKVLTNDSDLDYCMVT